MLKRVCTVLAMIGAIGSGAAQEASVIVSRAAVEDVLSCRSLASDTVRLSCLDAAVAQLAEALGRAEPAPPGAVASRGAAGNPGPQAAASPTIGEPRGRREERHADAGAEVEADGGGSEPAADFDPDAYEDREEFGATVVGVRYDPRNDRLYVKLENGQTWKQTDGPRVRTDDPPFAVTFKRGFLGGYRMILVGRDRTIRVSQVR